MERAARLRKGKEFDSVYSSGTVVSGRLLALRYLPNDLGRTRWGFAVGKRTARHATDRNRTKRRLREAADHTLLIPGLDIIVTARMHAPAATYQELAAALRSALRKAELLPRPTADSLRSARDCALRSHGTRGRAMKYPLLWLIRAYQVTFSRVMPPVCRFEPSCSHYAYDAVDRFGAFKGTWLAVRRLSRCRPGGGRGWDPVPEKSSRTTNDPAQSQ